MMELITRRARLGDTEDALPGPNNSTTNQITIWQQLELTWRMMGNVNLGHWDVLEDRLLSCQVTIEIWKT